MEKDAKNAGEILYMKIFYSWQSWSLSKTNRSFIEDALKQAIKKLNKELEIEMEMDRDTKDVPGSPSITESIFAKIDQCDLFLCDVSIVTSASEPHAIPNPNVLLELGYAASKLGWGRIIMVMNEANASPEKLPFDFQHRRWPIRYSYQDGDEKAEIKKKLVKDIFNRIELIVKDIEPKSTVVMETIERLLIDGGSRYDLKKLIEAEVSKAYEAFYSEAFRTELEAIENNRGFSFIQQCEKSISLYYETGKTCFDALASLCWYDEDNHAEFVGEAIKRWFHSPEGSLYHPMPNMLLIYIIGIIALHRNKWTYLPVLFGGGKPRPNREARPETIFDITVYSTFIHFERGKRRQISSYTRPFFGDYLQPTIRPTLEQYFYVNEEYNQAFDLFEAVLATTYLYQTDPTTKDGLLLPQIAFNSFDSHRSYTTVNQFWEETGKQQKQAGLLRVGLFEGQPDTLLNTLKQLEHKANNISQKLDYPLDVPTYTTAYESGLNQN